MKKVLISFLIIGAVITFIELFHASWIKPIERTVDSKLISNQQLGFDYLNSFNNVSLKEDGNSISYSGSKGVQDFYQVEYLANTNTDLSEYTLTFDVLYMSLLDLLYLNIYLKDTFGNIVEEETIHGYAIINENEERDIRFDIYGYTFYASDANIGNEVDTVAVNSILERMMSDGGGGVYYPILNVSNAIVGIDSAIANTYEFLQPPDLFWDDPLVYLMYNAKLDIAKADFINNNDLNKTTSSKQPNDFIKNQRDSQWDNWRFGTNNLGENGCGIIAMYNFMYDTGTQVDLPSLIAVTQILNADILFGVFGVNPYPDGLLISTSVFEAAFNQFILPIIMESIPKIARMLVNLEFELMPSWWTTVFGWTYNDQVDLTTAIIETAFIGLIAVVGVVAEVYWSTVHNMADVLSLYGFKNRTFTKMTLSSFETTSTYSNKMIMCQFNGLSGGNPNILNGLHYYYVRRVGDNSNNFEAINKAAYGMIETQNALYKFINGNKTNATLLFMAGLVFK